MAGFLKKLFGGGGSKGKVDTLLRDTLDGLIEKSGLDLSYDIDVQDNGDHELIAVNLSGADEDLMKDKKGQVIDAFQLFLKRAIQHNFPDDKTNVTVDCGGHREETEAALIERAEKLKMIAIEQRRSVCYRALASKDRKVVHQYLAQDPRVKSRSLGEGMYKKIKIFPVKDVLDNADETAAAQE